MLYETNENKQDLRKELRCIQNYLDLERIRYGDSLHIKMNISGELDDKKIASMLLLPFVENAFKHGANKIKGPVSILIDIEVQEGYLFFTIVNTLPDPYKVPTVQGLGGIGIANVRKRLELGYQKDEYQLRNYADQGIYKVELKLKLR